MRKAILFVSMLILLMGCTAKPADNETFVFRVEGHELKIGEKASALLEEIGNPLDQYTSPSCAFEGEDTVYDYGNFQITTYLSSGIEIFTGFYLIDASISTKEGIHIGSSFDQVISAYGDGYTEEYGVYTYTLGLSDLSFVIVEDTVTSISYLHIVD